MALFRHIDIFDSAMQYVPSQELTPVGKQLMESVVSKQVKKHMAEAVKNPKAEAKKAKAAKKSASKEKVEKSLVALESVFDTLISKGHLETAIDSAEDDNMKQFILSLNESIATLRKTLV